MPRLAGRPKRRSFRPTVGRYANPVDRIATLHELAPRPMSLPSEEIPEHVRDMLKDTVGPPLYVRSQREPDLTTTVRSVSNDLWRVDINSKPSAAIAGRPGHESSILPVCECFDTAFSYEETASFQPAWVTTAFLPKLIPRHCHRLIENPRIASMRQPQPMQTYDIVIEGFPFWPWQCAGKIMGGLDTDFDHPTVVGSAVLVGANIVVTASHCAVWGRGPGRWWMRFFPGWHDGPNPQLGSSFVEQFRGPGPQSTPNSSDFVVCKLYEPLGEAVGFMGVHWSSNDDFYYDQKWMSVGYPDYEFGGNRPAYDFLIDVEDIDNNGNGREIEVDLNNYFLNGGWSGGPLWGWFPGDDPRIIGVCSGWETDGWDPARAVFAGGGPLVDFIRDARRDWS